MRINEIDHVHSRLKELRHQARQEALLLSQKKKTPFHFKKQFGSYLISVKRCEPV